MANNNAMNISVGKPKAGGAIFNAPVGSTIPMDASSELDAAFVNLGFASEDGLVNAVETDSESIKAWGGEEVLVIQTSRTETFTFAPLENNTAVLEQVYGKNNVVVEGTSIKVLHNAKEKVASIWVFEVVLTGDRVMRIVVPKGKITEVGEITFVDGEAIKYEITLSCLPDADGNTAYTYLAAIASETPGGGE